MTTPPDVGAYRDVPDFIYGITREIWEDRGVGARLETRYAPNIILRAPTGLTTSNAGVTAQTLATLHQFPDRQLVGQDVIWSDGGDGSFLSSHRLISVMRHTGDGSYGPASGRIVKSQVIAECWVVGQVVTEEWLARDQSAFARCLGIEPRDLAASMLAHDRANGRPPGIFRPQDDIPADGRPGRYRPQVATGPEIDPILDLYATIWSRKGLDAVPRLYFHGATLHAPGGETRHGIGDIDRFYLSYLAAMPDARLTIRSAIVNRDPGRPLRLALRWDLHGTHTGFGRFGPPAGAPLDIMGFSHMEIVDGQVRAEWLVVDEVATWTQILAHADGG
jgi:predicted ester cyclase